LLKPKTVLALVVVLAIGGVALRGLVGRGRVERERSSRSSATAEAQRGEAELSSPPGAVAEDGAQAISLDGRTEVAPTHLEGRARKGAELTRGEARLLLEVVAREDGRALAGIHLMLAPKGQRWNPTGTQNSRGRPEETLITDAQGRAEFLVEEAQEYVLHLMPADDAASEQRFLEVPALAHGEARTLRVELLTRADLTWQGVVLDGETELPLDDATYAILRADPFDGYVEPGEGELNESLLPVRPDGRIVAEVATWADEVIAVACPGHAMGYVRPSRSHGPGDDPQRVLLWRAATLEVSIEGGSSDMELSARTPRWNLMQAESEPWVSWVSWEEALWQGTEGVGGTLLLEDLPPRVELTLEAGVSGRVLRHDVIVLEPGEQRKIHWRLGTGAVIEGHAFRPDGSAVAGLEVWLLGTAGLFNGVLERYMDDEVLARATTEEDGSFAFPDLAPGSYVVGPSPMGSSEPSLNGIAPFGTLVAIRPEDTTVPVSIQCWSGLEIRGRVLDPAGDPAANAHVLADGAGVLRTAVVANDGTFTLGPLVPGTYTLHARGDLRVAPSESVEAHTGDEDVELRLRSGGGLSVLVLDHERRPVKDAFVRLIPAGDDLAGWTSQRSDAEGRAGLHGVLPGNYLLIAGLGPKLAVRTGVEVVPKRVPDELELVLEPAVELTIRAAESEIKQGFRVRWRGHVLEMGFFDGPTAEVTVPAGEIEVELVSWSDALAFERLDAKAASHRAGERATIVFEARAGGR
jgi:carboxypeptidase family protein